MKKLITKKLIWIFIIANITISCNKTENNFSGDNSGSIRFWHFWSEPYQTKVIDSLILEFEKETNIKVEVSQLSWNNGKSKLIAAFNSGNPPDVLELGSDWVAQFSASDVLEKFEQEDLDKFTEFSKAPALWGQQVYALPWIVDTRVVFVNMSMLKKAGVNGLPNSFEEMLDIAKVIHNREKDIFGISVNGPDKNRLYKKAMTYIWSAGGDWTLDNLESENTLYGLELYKKSTNYGIVENQRNLDQMFVKGKIAFHISGAWLLNMLKKDNPILDYELMLIPETKFGKGMSFAGGEYIAVSKISKNKKQAKEFVKWLTAGKNTIEFCKKIPEGGFPADKKYFEDDYFNNKPEKLIFAKQLKYSKMTPVHPKWLEIQDILEESFERVIYDYNSPKDALRLAKKKMFVVE